MAEAELPKTASFSKEDRLSNLTDDLICHILSFLPTKVAYKTSVLSTRWTSLCTKVPDLHFRLPHSTSWSGPSISIHSISVGLLRRTEKIKKLSLHSNRCEPYAIHMWVTKALDLGVRELDLGLVFNSTIFLPRRLSTLESLVVLKLQGHIQPSLTSVAYLPSLKILNLEVSYWETKNVNRDYLSAFLSGCPCLEELQIRGRLQFPLEISLHFLKRLCLHLELDTYSQTISQPLRILNVPSIETFDIHDHSHHKYEVVNLFNVDRATLDISKPLNFDSLYKLMEVLSNVKSLYLEFCTVQVLQFLEKDNLDNLRHLQFHNLLCLRVQMSLNCNWDVLVVFLQNAPNLEVLIIEMQKYSEINSNRSKFRNSGWTKPTIIPTCLLTNFKVLEFRGIENLKKFGSDFMEYIVENSAKLEKVQLSTKSRKLKLERNKASVFTWV